MIPYYDHGGIQIYHGDCREVASLYVDKHFALAIADPPYGIGETQNASRQRHKGIAFGGTGAQRRKTGMRASETPSMNWQGADYDAARWPVDPLDAIRRVACNQVVWGGAILRRSIARVVVVARMG